MTRMNGGEDQFEKSPKLGDQIGDYRRLISNFSRRLQETTWKRHLCRAGTYIDAEGKPEFLCGF